MRTRKCYGLCFRCWRHNLVSTATSTSNYFSVKWRQTHDSLLTWVYRQRNDQAYFHPSTEAISSMKERRFFPLVSGPQTDAFRLGNAHTTTCSHGNTYCTSTPSPREAECTGIQLLTVRVCWDAEGYRKVYSSYKADLTIVPEWDHIVKQESLIKAINVN